MIMPTNKQKTKQNKTLCVESTLKQADVPQSFSILQQNHAFLHLRILDSPQN